jgi:pimeloyl-ACP methyl ester carboxylesterase
MIATRTEAIGHQSIFITPEAEEVYFHRYDFLLAKHDVNVEDVWIDTHLGRAHLIRTGNEEGSPTLLLHGAGLSAAEWFANYNALGESLEVYGLDMPGDAGKSSLKKSPKSIEDYQVSILQILDHLQIDKVILIGHSVGGFFATGFAIAYPERTEKLILVGPAATHVQMRWYIRLLLRMSGKAGTGPSAEKILKAVTFKGFDLDPDFVKLMEAVRDYTNVDILFPYVYSDDELSSLKLPVHLIIGDKESICSYKKSIRKAKEKIQQVVVHVIEGAVHIPHMEFPDQVNELIISIVNN